MIIRYIYVKNAGITQFQKLLTVLIQMEKWSCTEREDGSQIKKYMNGKKKNMKNNKKGKNIKNLDVENVIFYLIVEPSIF